MSQSKSFTINSGLIKNGIDGQFIQLVKVIQLEHSCSFEEALLTVKEYALKTTYELMNAEEKENLKTSLKTVTDNLKKTPKDVGLNAAYRCLKFLGVTKYL